MSAGSWFAGIFYMVWYIFRGMRNVYEQGRGLTLAKYLTLGLRLHLARA